MTATTIYVFSDYDCCCGGGAASSGPVAAFTDKDYADKYGKVHTGLDLTEMEISGDPGEIVTQYIAKTAFIRRPGMIIDGVVQRARWDREGLNRRRVEVLDKAGALQWCSRDKDTGMRFYRIGDILAAHATHPRRGRGSGA